MTEVHVHRFTNALISKGFERVEARHHTMFWLVVVGTRRGIRTRISHGQRRVDDWLLSEIARELHLSKRELLRFIECEITEQEYVRLMTERGCLGR